MELRGRVLTVEGRAIAGARVSLFPAVDAYLMGRLELTGGLLPQPSVQETTDDEGRYRLQLPVLGAWQVHLEAKGTVPVTSPPRVYGESQTLPFARLRPDLNQPLQLSAGEEAAVGHRFRAIPTSEDEAWRGQFWAPRLRSGEVVESGWLRLPRTQGEIIALQPLGPRATTMKPRELRILTPSGEPASFFLLRSGGTALGLADELGIAGISLAQEQVLEVLGPGGWQWSLSLPEAPPGQGEGPVILRLPAIPALTCQVFDTRNRPIPGALLWIDSEELHTVTTNEKAVGILPWPKGTDHFHGVAPGYLSATKTVATGAGSWTLQLRPAAAVAGRVVDEQSQGVADARVLALSPDDTPDFDKARTSDAEGFFQLSAVAAEEPFRLLVRRQDFAPWEETFHPEERDTMALVVTLTDGPSLKGSVVSDEDGAPIAFARIRLFDSKPSRYRKFELLQERETDSAGLFLFRHLPAKPLQLVATAPGFSPRLVSAMAPGPRSGMSVQDVGAIRLAPALPVSGRVVDTQDLPIRGAWVEISSQAPPRDEKADLLELLSAEELRVSTDEGGLFRFETAPSLPAIHLRTMKKGYADSLIDLVLDEETPRVTVVLKRARVLSGIVLDEDDQPVPRAQVFYHCRYQRQGSRGAVTSVEVTDQGGRFEAALEECDTVDVLALADSRTSQELKDLPLSADEPMNLVLRLRRRASLRGLVLDEEGRPRSGALVRLEFLDSETHPAPVLYTDENGSFETGSPAGTFRITAEWAELTATEEGNLEEGQEAFLRLRLQKATDRIRGRVVDEGGRPLKEAGIILRSTGSAATPGSPHPNTSSSTHHTSPDRQGRFELPFEPADALLLRVEARGFRPTSIHLDPQQPPREALLITLLPGAKIRGRVTGLSPERLQEVRIQAFDESPEGRSSLSVTSVSEDGSFVLDSVGEGTWTVRANLGRVARSASATVTLAPGQDEGVVEIHFEEGVRLSGTLSVNRQPGNQKPVHLESAGRIRVLHTDAAGRFAFEGIESGSVTLTTEFGSRQLELVADTEIHLEFETFTVAGTVMDQETSLPIPEANLRIMSPLGSQGYEQQTDGEGRFLFPQLPSGTLRILARKEGYPPVDLSVDPRQEQEVEIRLNRGNVLVLRPLSADGPVAPSQAAARVLSADGRTAAVSSGSLDNAGHLVFPGLPAGTHRLLFFTESYALADQTFTVPGGPYDLFLEASTSLVAHFPPAFEGTTVARFGLWHNGVAVPDPSVFVASSPLTSPPQITLRALPAGLWMLELEMEDGRKFRGSATTAPGPATVIELAEN